MFLTQTHLLAVAVTLAGPGSIPDITTVHNLSGSTRSGLIRVKDKV